MIRYRKLGYVALNVSDLDRSVAFYRDMAGLDLVEHTPGKEAFLSCNGDHHNIQLVQAAEASLKRIAYQLEDVSQIGVAESVLTQAGVPFERVSAAECGRLRIGSALRFRDPNGVPFELFASMISRPQRFVPHPTDLSHLSHAVVKIPQFDRSLAFYREVMNFRVSDFRHEPTGEPYFAFMRCFPNPYHHSFAVVASSKAAFFHIAFTVRSLDDLMFGRNRLKKAGVIIAPTPGRHMASGSVFQYFADPDGFTLEYTWGMEEFPEVGAREPRMLDKSNRTTDIWDGERPTNMPDLGRIEPPGAA
jgi:2,3-dihydroxy-p-cumate/2,3-dihydroxybenzoate 3,4-dioxygenase